jgi:hypothetical protein
MNEVSGDQQSGDTKLVNLREAIEVLRARLSSVRVETHLAESHTALSVRFLGNASNLEERQLLVSQLASYLPPALSIMGVQVEQKQDEEMAGSSDQAA